jgi:hypothetical protein
MQEGSVSGSLGGLSSCSTPIGIEAGDEQRSRKHKVALRHWHAPDSFSEAVSKSETCSLMTYPPYQANP